MNDSIRQQLWDLAMPIVESVGCELIELEYVRESGWIVRLFIERPGVPIIEGFGVAPGDGVGLEDCTRVSRELSAVLDVEDCVPHAFKLEVSSPGARRPLRRVCDFTLFRGCQVRVRTQEPIVAIEPEGKYPGRNLFGLLDVVTDEHIEVIVDKRRYRIPYTMIVKAHLEPDMDQWMALAKKARENKGE